MPTTDELQAQLDALSNTVATKADTDPVTTLQNQITTKADSSAVALKANQTDLDALSTTVSGKASQTSVDALTTTVAGKADHPELDALRNLTDATFTAELDGRYGKQPILDAVQAQLDAKADATALAIETSRAESAEALLQPIASLESAVSEKIGTSGSLDAALNSVYAPGGSAGNQSATDVSNAITAAVSVETIRAQNAESLLEPRANLEVDVASKIGAGGVLDTALESTYVSGAPTTAPTDGQYLRWDAATSRYVPVNPIGNSELAVAENVTGGATSLTTAGGAGTIVAIPFTAISVGDSSGRQVTLFYEASFLQSTAGAGTVFLLLYETTSSATLIGTTAVPLTGLTDAAQQQVAIPLKSKRIGVVTTARTFELRAYIYGAASDDSAGSILNGTTQPTVLRAVAG